MNFLILVLTYVVQRKFNLTLSRQHDVWAEQYLDFFEKNMPVVRHNSVLYLAIGILLPACLLTLLLVMVDNILFGALTLFINFFVLFMCLGCGYLKNAMDTYLNHWLEGRYELALQTLEAEDIRVENTDNLSQAEIHQAACAEFVYQTFHHYFIIIFWFMVAGPVGALVSRLANVSSESNSAYRPQRVDFLCQLLEWLPARLLALTFALVGNFSAVMKQSIGKLSDPFAKAKVVLEYSAASALSNNKYNSYPPASVGSEQTERKAVQLVGLRELLNRALVIWLGTLAILAILDQLL